MAYQNVGTPRFYIDLYEWMNSIGNIDRIDHNNRITLTGNPFGLNPSEPCVVSYNAVNPEGDGVTTAPGTIRYYLNTPIDRKITSKINYHAIIGHNSASCEKTNEVNITAGSGVDLENLHFRPNMAMSGVDGTYLGLHSNSSSAVRQPLVNCEISPEMWSGSSGYIHALNDGFSIIEAYPSNDDENERDYLNMNIGMDGGDYWLNTNLTVNLNCISVGTFYDMPHSPELDLTMTIENDGYDAIATQGGAHLSNIRYTGAPMWERADGTKVPPWTIGEPTAVGRRHGRRVWNLKFNYLNDSDLFASNYMNTTYLQSGSDTGYDSDDLTTDGNNFYYTLENDDSFHAQVLNKVGNGQRFIFQPDNTNNNPDQFAICQLDQDSLNIKQVANSVYNIALKIREVW